VQSEWGQNWLVQRVTSRLSRDLQSRIHIDRVRLVLFNKLNMEGVLVEDRQRDTLLSAGIVQVRITDWFFLKDKAELEYIGLKDATIKLQRSDSVWNYQHLADYFSSPSTGQRKESGLELQLRKAVLENVRFVQRDAWTGNDVYGKVGFMELDAHELSLSRNRFVVDRLVLEATTYHEFGYKGRRSAASRAAAAARPVPPDTSGLRWNPGRLFVSVAELQLRDARFRSDKGGKMGSALPYFDGDHIDFSGITGSVRDLRFYNDTLSAGADLVARERSGLQVKNLRTRLRFHPELMEFDKLLIRTNRSTLRNYFAMRMNSWDDLGDFVDKVEMDGHFDDSQVSTDDIALFAPDLKTWDRQVFLDGRIKGFVDALEGRNVKLRTGQTSLEGDFTVQGLTTPERVFLNVDARDLVTNYQDVSTLIPDLRTVSTPNLRRLGNIRFTGTYTGFFQDFVAFGTLHTSLGTLRTDLNMKLPAKGVPVYSGSIASAAFDLGPFLNNKDLGNIAFRADVKGRGFTSREADVELRATIDRIGFKGYTYRNLVARGHVDGQAFNGHFGINDPHAEGTVDGLIGFGTKVPTFNATARIEKLDFKALGLATENLSLSGNFRLNGSGGSLTGFSGTAGISEATLLQNGNRLSFDSLLITATQEGNARQLHIRSNELDARVEGQFDLTTLPDAFQLFLNRYYPTYISPPRRSLPPQNFTFDIRTGLVEDYLRILDKRLSGGNNSHVRGSLDLRSNTLTLDADIPQVRFGTYDFSGIQLSGDGDITRLRLNGDIANTIVGDSLQMPETSFWLQSSNDVSDVVVSTSSNQAINQANLSARITTLSDGLRILFHPSSFMLNGKTWTVSPGGNLEFRKNTITEGNVILRESDQEIRLSTVHSEAGTHLNDLRIDLSNINLDDITPFLTPNNRIEGVLNGTVLIEDPENRFYVDASLQANQLRVDNDSIGQLQAQLTFDRKTGNLKGNGRNTDPDHQLKFDLDLDLDSVKSKPDLIAIEPVNYPVKYLENFVGSLFSDLKGFVTGRLQIVGSGAQRRYVGRARLRDASMIVNFTQVRYRIDDTEILLEEDRIDLGTMRLRDTLNNTATVRGSIAHQGFQNMVFDLRARTESAPMVLLNTTYANNQTFYGRARGTGSFVLSGAQNNMYMDIDARASDRDSSWITLPPSKTRESGTADFLVERKYGTEMTPQTLANEATNIRYSVSMHATPYVNVEVILDDLTGDAIRGRGTGDLSIESGTNLPLSINGRYNIEEGSYLFTFQSFFKKPFVLRRGGNNFIEWNGDPYDARIRFEALYEARNVRYAPLISQLALNDPRLERLRGDVNVVALLTGDLFRPTFSFRLEFPENSPVNTNPSFAYGLQQIERNPDEINKQVTYLIVFNSFAPVQSGQGVGSTNAFNEFAYNTISGLIFGEVNRVLNQVLGKVLTNNKVTFNFSGSLYNRDLLNQTNRGFGINTSNINFSLSAPVAGDRVQITFGGSLDVPVPGSNDINQRIFLYPDVSVDVLINKSGSIRATFFYTQSPDPVVGNVQSNPIRNQRAGAKVSYRKEFDRLSDLFRKKKPAVPADTTRPNTEADDRSLQQQPAPRQD